MYVVMGIAIMLLFVGIIIGIVLFVIRIVKKKRLKKMKTYTGMTMGTIQFTGIRGNSSCEYISVAYDVDWISYMVTETMKVRHEAMKIGKIPVGQRIYYVLGQVKVGDQIWVHYLPQDLAKAIIPENYGISKCWWKVIIACALFPLLITSIIIRSGVVQC